MRDELDYRLSKGTARDAAFRAQEEAHNRAQREMWERTQATSRGNNVIDAEYTEVTDVPMLDLKPETDDKE